MNRQVLWIQPARSIFIFHFNRYVFQLNRFQCSFNAILDGADILFPCVSSYDDVSGKSVVFPVQGPEMGMVTG